MSFEDLMKSLQAEYLSSLPKKVESIRTFIPQNATDELREAFHKLKGTGRTYGFPEISELGALVESVCIQFPTQATTASQHACQILDAIHSSRVGSVAYDLHQDPRFDAIKSLLQN